MCQGTKTKKDQEREEESKGIWNPISWETKEEGKNANVGLPPSGLPFDFRSKEEEEVEKK